MVFCHNADDPVPAMETSTDPDGAPTRHARDLQFARLVLAGDPAALEQLDRRLACLPAMVRHQNRSLGGHLDANELEDVVRETTLALWTKLPAFEGRSTLETWAYRFALLEVLKALQARTRRPRPLETPELCADDRGEYEELAPCIDGKELLQGLAELSSTAAEVIRLRHWDELPFERIAERTGLPLNTIKARYYRGLARLREILERRQRRTGS
jgi:RNA polymerase sigma-70 factor (ECF subfamily)